MSDTTYPTGKLALIVEDDVDCAELLKMILEDDNWRVKCVRFGSEALLRWCNRAPPSRESFPVGQALPVQKELPQNYHRGSW